MPQRLSWKSLNAWSYWALMRPTTRPSRRARKNCASPCLKNALTRRLRNSRRSSRSGGTQTGAVECSRNGSSTNSRRSRRPRTGPLQATRGRTLYADRHRRLRQGPRARARGAAARRPRSRPAALLPPPGVARGAGGGDGGRPADHAGLQQLPRPDRRRARHAGRPRRAGALRHRADRLAAAQRHDRPAPRARARAGRVDGHRGRDRVHHRPPGQRGHARHDPRRPATR